MTFKRHLNTLARQRPAGETTEGDWAWPLAFADRACCCAARPVVVVVMPSTPTRQYPMDLLLCNHHYNLSRAALVAKGAAVYDETGARLTADTASEQEFRRDAGGNADPEHAEGGGTAHCPS